jgi:hypothetical protein
LLGQAFLAATKQHLSDSSHLNLYHVTNARSSASANWLDQPAIQMDVVDEGPV